MLTFLLKKISYGLLVLAGVVTVVFFLFNLAPGDPVRNLVGENASEQTLQQMRRKLDLDLPLGKRFVLYVNDLSPVSVHNTKSAVSRIYFDEHKYNGLQLFPVGSQRVLFLKYPYLKRSFLSDRNVSEILSDAIPGTVVLAVVSILFALVIGLVMGIISALKRNSIYDRLMLFISALGMAGPSFFVAIIVAWIGAVLWRDRIEIHFFPWLLLLFLIAIGIILRKMEKTTFSMAAWFLGASVLTFSAFMFVAANVSEHSFLMTVFNLPGTGLNMTGSLYGVDVWKGETLELQNMILPVITLMIRPLSVIVQLTRSSLLDVLAQDYVRTARAKGLPEYVVILKHALRNALNPVITAVSGWFASLLAGAVFVEFVFGWKGLGQQMFTAIESQDLPVVMGGVIVIATAFVVINIFVDIIYGWIDPRVRVG